MSTAQATRPAPARASSNGKPNGSKPEAPILFQKYFKSDGDRTYAAQVKEARTGNHFLVLTDGHRDKKTGELRKSMVFLFSEDFPAFFRMLHETAQFIRENPVPHEVRERRAQYLKKRGSNRHGEPQEQGDRGR
jgi:hypothetical protein